MISLLTGELRALTNEKVIVDVGGVGYSVSVTSRTASHLTLGALTTLHTTLVVREDSMTLFGFLDARERDIYEQLQSVTGVGPKVALAITGVLSPESLALAIAHEDVAAIEKVPGIGKKGAQRLILELKGKLVSEHSAQLRSVADSSIREQLLSALTGLGFTAKEADKAINSTFAHLSEISENPDKYQLSELLRLTLQSGKR